MGVSANGPASPSRQKSRGEAGSSASGMPACWIVIVAFTGIGASRFSRSFEGSWTIATEPARESIVASIVPSPWVPVAK